LIGILIKQRLTQWKTGQIGKKVLECLQQDISQVMARYMKKYDLGFNDLVKHLDSSPTHIAKIQKGTANLTLSSLAHLCAKIGEEPKLVFKKR